VKTTEVYLERIDRTRNMARYYRLSIAETLFGHWTMIREWGRIGSRGQSREHWCRSRDEAVALLEDHRQSRTRRGYRQHGIQALLGQDIPCNAYPQESIIKP
jgi:predicted DNA-binding WGR domain protein